MIALCTGLLTAFMLGFLLWGGRYAMTAICLLFVGGKVLRSRGGRVCREIGACCYILFGSCAVTIFMYYVNRGIFRWFLCAAILLSYCLLIIYLGHRLLPGTERVTDGVRHRIVVIVGYVCTPFIRLYRRLFALAGRVWHKLTLPICQKCDKIKVSLKNRKKRRRIERIFRGMLAEFGRNEKHEHQNDFSR